MTPELKWPTTKWTPSPRKLLATETPWRGSAASSPTVKLDLLAVDAAGGVDVGDGLLGAVLELGAEGRVRARHRTGDADLELGAVRCRSRRSRATHASASAAKMIADFMGILSRAIDGRCGALACNTAAHVRPKRAEKSSPRRVRAAPVAGASQNQPARS